MFYFLMRTSGMNLFNHVPFDIICLETSDAIMFQTASIIMALPKNSCIYVNVNGIFIEKTLNQKVNWKHKKTH